MRFFYARNSVAILPNSPEHHFIILDTPGACTFYIGGADVDVDAEGAYWVEADRRGREDGVKDVFRALIGGGWSYWHTELRRYEGADKERIDEVIERHGLKKF